MSSRGQFEIFDDIMGRIMAGLTGKSETDTRYLGQKMDEYKAHPLAKDIFRACRHLLDELQPSAVKEDVGKPESGKAKGLETELKEIRALVSAKDFQVALQQCQALVDRVEALDLFKDDKTTEYREFNELFELILYNHYNEPEKLASPVPIPFSAIYDLYGEILVKLGQFKEARAAVRKGLHWNPVNFELTSDYIETFKLEKDMDQFLKETRKAFKLAFRPSDVARCFQNLGYYFVEKKLYREAAGCYFMSEAFEETEFAASELGYIEENTEEPIEAPSMEEMEAVAEKYHFPWSADPEVLGLAYAYGQNFLEDDMVEEARYCFTVFYNLTDDEETKELLDGLPTPEMN